MSAGSSSAALFEQQVERLAIALEDVGAAVEWNVSIRDPDTQRPRQIDVRITRENGYQVYLECRDKGRKQDVMWIEELIGRRESLRVDEIVAVSASGFTEPALRKAAAKRVGARALPIARISQLTFSAAPPDMFIPFLSEINIDVHLFVSLDRQEKVRNRLSINGADLFEWATLNVIKRLSEQHDPGPFAALPRRSEMHIKENFTILGFRIPVIIVVGFKREWGSVKPVSRRLQEGRDGRLHLAAELHSGDLHGARLDLVMGERGWTVILDYRRLKLSPGSMVQMGCTFGSADMGGREIDFQFLSPPNYHVELPIRYLMQPVF